MYRFFSSKNWLIVFMLLALVGVSNKWLSWEDGIHLVQAYDVKANYEVIAQSSPKLPEQEISFHHAQRLILPYSIGFLSKITGMSYRSFFLIACILCLSITVYVLLLFCGDSNIAISSISSALFLFNPYITRYFLLAPGMLTDCAFLLGFALLLFALSKTNIKLLYAGIILCSISKQTILLLIPGITYWIFCKGSWKKQLGNRRYLVLFTLIAIILGIYFGTSYLVSDIAKSHVDAMSLMGFVFWLTILPFRYQECAEFLVRIFLPLWIYLVFFALLWLKKKRLESETKLFLLQFLLVIAQPILYGPAMTGKNVGRLISLSFIALLFALVNEWKAMAAFAKLKWYQMLVFIFCLFLLSLHHVYSVIGPSSLPQFLFLQIFVPLQIFFFAYIFEKWATPK